MLMFPEVLRPNRPSVRQTKPAPKSPLAMTFFVQSFEFNFDVKTARFGSVKA
jgi:hypothetical protein